MNTFSNYPEFNETNVRRVLGVPIPGGQLDYGRTPLHIDFDPKANDIEPDYNIPSNVNPKLFNAVGSLLLRHNADKEDYPDNDKYHMPVLDIDLPIEIENRYDISRVTIEVSTFRKKEYKPDNWLKPLLSKMGIELEVFSEQKLSGGEFSSSVTPPYVKSVVLSAREVDRSLVVFPSSTKDHGHLYLNHPLGINWESYRELLKGFNDIGVIENEWFNQSIKQGMTIVRTPWTKAEAPHKRS